MQNRTSPLLTDLYQLTMLEAYLREGLEETAVFEFYVRNLPEKRNFLVSAGLESVLSFLENLAFTGEEIRWLSSTGRFSDRSLDYLRGCSFTGDVYAIPEGTIFFAGEPLIRIAAPLPLAQLVETRIINLLHFETIIASKAARCVLAAGDRAQLVDFGLRRAHGAEAGILAARSSYLAGFAGTATVLAGFLYDIPIFGTMAHSYIEAHGDEEQAFVDYGMANPGNVTLLIDTFDTMRGARRAADAVLALKERGIATRAVRLDSGDIPVLSAAVRKILDDRGLEEVKILVSGDMDEYAIRDLLAVEAPIDAFGVGTKMDTSEDAPYLQCAYKLMEYAGTPRLKKSPAKATMPGRKQVFRRFANGIMNGDTVTLEGDDLPGLPLIAKVMDNGKRLLPAPDLKELRARTREQLGSLPGTLRSLDACGACPVDFAPALLRLREEAENSIA